MLTLRSFYPFIAAALVAMLLLTIPLHHASAQVRQPRTYQTSPVSPFPPAPEDEQERQRTSRGWWLIPVVIVGCLILDCLSGSGGGQGNSSTPDAQGRWKAEDGQKKRESLPAGDPPGICYWGDTTMGTCVK